MSTLQRTASDVLRTDGDDFRSQYLRAIYVYSFSIALLFPPPFGGVKDLSASTIVSTARTIAAARLFDYRIFNLASAWNTSEREVIGIKLPRKTLRPKAAFQDEIVRSIFSNKLFDRKRGISHLLGILDFNVIEEQFDKRIEEMDALADIVNIYMLCTPEIEKFSHSNGLDVVIRLYLECISAETGDRTLANNWRRLKAAAIFHYLYKYQSFAHRLFSPPMVQYDEFPQIILAMSGRESIIKLVQAHDYVSTQLNNVFTLDLRNYPLPLATGRDL